MSHTPHPDVREHGLADDCPRCAEHAENPFGLDDFCLSALIDRTLTNRFDTDAARAVAGSPRSDAEARAMAVVMTALEHAGRIASQMPISFAHYLDDRWRVSYVWNPNREEN